MEDVNKPAAHDPLFIDLGDIDVSEVEVLTTGGKLGMEPFAASTGNCGNCGGCNEGGCSCSAAVVEADHEPEL